jgi:putative membrane protein
MKINFLSCTLALGVAMGLSPANAQTMHHHKAGLTDALFAKKAAAGGLTEVALGQIAEQNASSQEIKDFGAKMVADHGKANDALKAVAAKDSLTIPDKPNAEQQELIDKLTKETGKKFDTTYVHAMVKAHIADKALFAEEIDDAKNPDLKQFASDTLPVIKEHLGMIEGIENGGSHDSAAASTQGGDMPMMGTSGESKSGLAPGSNANPAPESVPSTPSMAPATNAPDVGSSGESKSGLAPGSNANPVPATSPAQ